MQKYSKEKRKAIRKSLPVPRVRIEVEDLNNHPNTRVYLDGKELRGITEISYNQKAKEASLQLAMDPSAVQFKNTPSRKI